MGKTRGEIQKAYRERLKQILKDSNQYDDYKEKEVHRVQKYYTPVTDLSNHELHVRRKKIRNAVTKHRLKQQHLQAECGGHGDHGVDVYGSGEVVGDSHYDGPRESTPPSCSTRSQLVVKLPNLLPPKPQTPKSSTRKRTSRAVGNAHRRIRTLIQENQALQRKNWSLKKQQYRQKQTQLSQPEKRTLKKSDTMTTPLQSPRSKAQWHLRESGISPSKAPSVARELQLHYAIMHEVKNSVTTEAKSHSKMNPITVVSGSIVKKYRLQTKLRSHLHVHRRRLASGSEKRLQEVRKNRLLVERAKLKETIVSFLEQSENSTCLPGKQDSKKCGKTLQQKRVLNDYLHNLHSKFLYENPDVHVSLSVFCKCRPLNMILVSFGTRKTCLCQQHQNMALKLKALKSVGLTTATNPDTFIKSNDHADILEKIETCESERITFSEWKRVEVTLKDRVSKRMKTVATAISKHDFRQIMQHKIADFQQHVHRVTTQYQEIRQLKQKLPDNQVICQMDFAENYACSHADEIQSAYFDKGTVTLHPVVVYFKQPDSQKLEHKSFIFVSDTVNHNTATVHAIIQKLIPELQNIKPDVKVIHYVTDSPTSQYRNKHIFHMVSIHDQLFPGIKATWQYFEAGHGKGPCDGVGGTAKRMADQAVRQQKYVIQDAEDFYCWGKSQKSELTYIFVHHTLCDESQETLNSWPVKPVKGTMKVHSVVPVERGTIAIRATSCFCNSCFQEDGTCHQSCVGWEKHTVVSVANATSNIQEPNLAQQEANHPPQEVQLSLEEENPAPQQVNLASMEEAGPSCKMLQVGGFVAAIYDKQLYIGQIMEADDCDMEYKVNFLQQASSKHTYTFKWPMKADVIWIPLMPFFVVWKSLSHAVEAEEHLF